MEPGALDEAAGAVLFMAPVSKRHCFFSAGGKWAGADQGVACAAVDAGADLEGTEGRMENHEPGIASRLAADTIRFGCLGYIGSRVAEANLSGRESRNLRINAMSHMSPTYLLGNRVAPQSPGRDAVLRA